MITGGIQFVHISVYSLHPPKKTSRGADRKWAVRDVLAEASREPQACLHVPRQFVICAIGGGTGAALLLITGEGVFEAVVPWLIAFASLTLFVSPRLKKLSSGTERWRIYLCSLFVVCLYGGYFGAGAGVVYFALVLLLTSYPWPRAVLMKSVLLSISNLAATVIFVIFAPIDWLAALILFVGNLIGGNIGPLVQRYIPEAISRWVIAIGGLFLAWSLWR